MKHIHSADVLPEGVSHNPEIMKRVYLRNGEIPSVTTFAQATLQPGQSVAEHDHQTMYEVYCIQEGKAEFVVGGEIYTAAPGDCVVIEPKERHAQQNPFDVPVTWLYFGIATDE